jgi:hypothetical protein
VYTYRITKDRNADIKERKKKINKKPVQIIIITIIFPRETERRRAREIGLVRGGGGRAEEK